MTKITADAGLLARLDNLNDLVELCDASGRTLGYFHPIISSKKSGSTVSPISDEEIERCRQQRTGRALSDIFADLESQP